MASAAPDYSDTVGFRVARGPCMDPSGQVIPAAMVCGVLTAREVDPLNRGASMNDGTRLGEVNSGHGAALALRACRPSRRHVASSLLLEAGQRPYTVPIARRGEAMPRPKRRLLSQRRRETCRGCPWAARNRCARTHKISNAARVSSSGASSCTRTDGKGQDPARLQLVPSPFVYV